MFNNKNKQVSHWATCRDYLGELIWSQIHNKSTSIYGFKADPSVDPKIDFENTRILMRNKQDSNFLDKIDGVIHFVNQVENLMDFRNSEAFIVANSDDKNGVVGAVSSARWMRSPTLISLYTLLLRVGFIHNVGDDWRNTIKQLISGDIKPYQRNDADYLRSSIKGIERILNVGYKNIFYKQMKFNFPEKKNVSKLHNSSGIVAFASGEAKNICNGWYRPELEEIEKGIKEEDRIVIL